MGQRIDVGRREEPEPAHCHHQQPRDNAAFVTQFAGQPAGRHGHEKVSEVMSELDPSRLRLGQTQLLLKMLVHHVDHSIAHPPKEKQRTDEDKGEEEAFAIVRGEEAFFICAHGVSGAARTVWNIGELPCGGKLCQGFARTCY